MFYLILEFSCQAVYEPSLFCFAGLIAMAQDVESLYAAVKALVCVVRTNRAVQLEMDRCRGYQTLAMLLRRKRPLLNSHILHLTFSLVGTVDSGRESSSIPNITAFQDLLCDIEVTVINVYFHKVLWSQIKYSETLLRSF